MHCRGSRILLGVFLILTFVGADQPAIAQEPRAGKRAVGVEPGTRIDVYGDPLPPGVLARMGTLRDYIGDASSRVIFSPGGTFVTATSAYVKPRLRLWDPATGRVVREFKELDPDGDRVGHVAFSPDGKLIAVADDELVRLARMETGRMIREFSGYDGISEIAFSPDGKVLVANDSWKGTPRFWNIATGTQTHWPSLAGYRPVTFTHFFEVVGLRRSGGALSLRFGVSGHEIRSDRLHPGDPGLPIPVAMSPDRAVMASYQWGDNTIRLRNVATGRTLPSLPRYRDPPGLLNHIMEDQVQFSPDGKLLAAGDTRTSLTLWDVATGRPYRRFHDVPIEMGFAFAPDGKQVVTGGRHFRYWDIARGQEIRRYPQRAAVTAVAFTPDGKALATAAGLDLRLWDTATGREIPRFKSQHASRALLHPKDAGTGREIRSYLAYQPKIRAMTIAPDGKTLVSGADDGSLWLWETNTGRAIRQVEGLRGSIDAIAFAPNGKAFAAIDERGAWFGDLGGSKEIHHFSGPADRFVESLSFSPDGITLASMQHHVVSLWNMKTTKLWKELDQAGHYEVVVFGPEGKTIAAGDRFGVIRVWDVTTGAVVVEFAREVKPDAEPPAIRALVFTPDGKTLASAGDDHFVTLWDLSAGRERRRLNGHAASVNSLAIAPDGKTLASCSDDGTALIWEL